jgi:hypothetical protein
MMRAPFRLSAFVAGIFILVVSTVPGLAVEIKQVKSPAGITALLVEDYTVPIVTVSFSFRGGAAQDPSGREGMADLISTLFDEGAGPYDSKAFQARLEQFGVRLRVSEGLDRFTGTMRVLKDDAATGFEMLRLALTELHFEQSAIDRMRAALISNIKAEANDAQVRAARAMRESLFANHPYSRSSDGTIEGLNAITRDEIVHHFGKLFARWPAREVGACCDSRGTGHIRQAHRGRGHRLTDHAGAGIPRGEARFARILRRLSDEPHSRRRKLFLAPLRRGAREARPVLLRRLVDVLLRQGSLYHRLFVDAG